MKIAGPGLAALLLPGPTAAMAGSAANQLVDRLTRDWGRQAALNAARTAELAAEQGGITVDELGERIAQNPDARQVASKVFPAAANASTEQQLRLLARILSNATMHPERVDEESLLASAVSDLESTHFRLLATLVELPPPSNEPTKANPRFWSGGILHVRLGWQPEVIVGLLLALQSRGLLYLTNSRLDGSGGTWAALENVGGHVEVSDLACQLTTLGELVIERAREAGR